jgi:acetolactate synthase-1/2/3 large subunit
VGFLGASHARRVLASRVAAVTGRPNCDDDESEASLMRMPNPMIDRLHHPYRAVDHIVDRLVSLGVSHVFGVGGANIEDLYDAAYHHGSITAVLAKHEFSASTMADGFARTTSRLGVVAATSGGGALNLLAGLGEAFMSRVPVLALVGQPPTTLAGRGVFQDSSGLAGTLDGTHVFSAVSRYCALVQDVDELPARLSEAISAALSAPNGPAVLLLPKDVQQAAFSHPPRSPLDRNGFAESIDVADVAGQLEKARANGPVVIIAGDGVARADARTSLARLAEGLDAKVAVAPDARDVFDNHHARFLGVAGIMGHPAVAEHLGDASACLLVGTRLPMVARAGLEKNLAEITVISVDNEPPYLDSTFLPGDLASTLTALGNRLSPAPAARPAPATPPEPLRVPPKNGDGMGYTEMVAAINAAVPQNASVFVDAGNACAAVIHNLLAPKHGRFVVALGMGGMGYTFGAGIGATFGGAARTYVLAGDGAFYMHGMEIHTAVEYDLPVTFVILNNNAHAMCVTREQIYYGGKYTYNRFRRSDLAAGVAAMFPSLHVHAPRTADELAAVLFETNATHGPVFVAVDCDPDEIPPFVPFLAKENHRVHAG